MKEISRKLSALLLSAAMFLSNGITAIAEETGEEEEYTEPTQEVIDESDPSEGSFEEQQDEEEAVQDEDGGVADEGSLDEEITDTEEIQQVPATRKAAKAANGSDDARTVTITFYDYDGDTVDETASIGDEYYLVFFNNGVKGVEKITPKNGVATLTFLDSDNTEQWWKLLQLVRYTGGDLTESTASGKWYYDGEGTLTKPNDFEIYSLEGQPVIEDNHTYNYIAVKRKVYEYSVAESTHNPIELEEGYRDNWYLLSTLTKADGKKLYHIDGINLYGLSAFPETGTKSIGSYQEKDNSGSTALYESGDTVVNELVHVSQPMSNYYDVVDGTTGNNRESFGDGDVVGKYKISSTSADGVGTITLTKSQDFTIKTEFKDANGGSISSSVPSDYYLLVKMVRGGKSYYALHKVSDTNPSSKSEPIVFKELIDNNGNKSIGTTPNYYSGTETISTQVVTGTSDLLSAITSTDSSIVRYNENTIGGTQNSDLTKDLFSSSSTITDGTITTVFTKKKDDGKDHTITVSFYKKRENSVSEAKLNPSTSNMAADSEGQYFFRVRLYNNNKLIGYKIVPVSTTQAEDANNTGKFSLTIPGADTFQLVDDKGVDIAGGGLHYDPSMYTCDVRLYKTTGSVPTNLSDISNNGTDQIEGYDFWQNVFSEQKTGDEITSTNTDISLYQAYKKIYQVKVVIDPEASPDSIALNVKAEHKTTNTDSLEIANLVGSEQYRSETTTDGKTIITYVIENQEANTYNWTTHPENNTISGNETFTLLLKQNGKEVNEGYPVKIGNEYYTVHYDTGNVSGTNVNVDDARTVTTITHYVNLTKATYDDAITPYDVLGEGEEYGVVANEYIKCDHSETNFAVNVFREESSAGFDLAANNGESNVMPYYVGEYNVIHFTSNVTVNPEINTPSTKSDPYVHNSNNSEESTDHIHQDGGGYDVTVIPTPKEEVQSYVNGLINKLTESSETYRDKPSVKAGGKVVDTTSFPDNTTIYIDSTDLIIDQPGWTIKKLEGQSIVLNIPGDTVDISKEVVSVYKYDENGNLVPVKENLDSNTGGNGGNKEHNADVEEYILNHIVFNAYEASKVNFTSGPAGLFLAPNAYVEEISGSGTGWVATGNTFKQTSSEWHFFRTQRKYRGKGDFTLSGKKKIVEGTEAKDYSEFSSMKFEFELYKVDQKTGEKTGDAIEKTKADSKGDFSFTTLKFTETDVPKGQTKTFYYVIKEVVPEGGKSGNVSYNAAPVYVRVVAEDNSEGVISLTISKAETFSTAEENSVWVPIEGSVKEGSTKKIYEIGDFTNSYSASGTAKLSAEKAVSGAEWPTGKTATFKLTAEDGAPLPTTGTEKDLTEAGSVEFGEIEYTAEGTYVYKISETSNWGPGWSVSPTTAITATVKVTDNGNGTLETSVTYDPTDKKFTNSYSASGTAKLSAEKAVSGVEWPTGKTATFKLTAEDGAPLPTTGTEKDLTEAGSVEFGEIEYT
ncbi:MAG: hypothetical protein IJ225_12610, partial [Solobacterium sp.]|nr:hypothetical protein [Solobacterium sp.]